MAFPKNCSREIAKRLGVPEVEILAAALASQAYPSWAPCSAGGPVFLEGSDAALASAIGRLHDNIGQNFHATHPTIPANPATAGAMLTPAPRYDHRHQTLPKRHRGNFAAVPILTPLEKNMNSLVDEVARIQTSAAAAAREKLLRRYRLEISVESPDAKTLAKLSAADLGFDAATVGRHLAAVREAHKLAENTSVWGEAQYLEELKVLNQRHGELEAAKLQLERDFDESRQKLGKAMQRRQLHSDSVGRLAALKKANPEIFPADSSKVA